jgi:hypothetical protein
LATFDKVPIIEIPAGTVSDAHRRANYASAPAKPIKPVGRIAKKRLARLGRRLLRLD